MNTIQSSKSVMLLFVLLIAATAPTVSAQEANTAPGANKTNANKTNDKETKLIAVLRSDAPKAEKAITCKLLAIHGSSRAVPELARLLNDPQLASWARIALEAIPGSAADEALRSAAERLDGKLLIGVVNSIGVRRDAQAVPWLATAVGGENEEVAAAAAAALGRIADDAATKALRQALASATPGVRSAVAESCVRCAERLEREGKKAEAIAIYDEIREADLPQQRIIEATRGAVLARGENGIPMLLALLKSPEKKFFRLALGMIREFPGDRIDQSLPAVLGEAPPERAAMIVYAMADRPETVVLSAIRQAAEQGPKPVRLAALESLGRVGDGTCLATLLAVARQDDAELAEAAKQAIAELPSKDIDGRLVSNLDKADAQTLPLLLEIVGRRRIDAQPALSKALRHSGGAVRRAALGALGETVGFKDLSLLIEQVVAPADRGDVEAATRALKVAAVRMPDRESCAAELTRALNTTSNRSTKIAILDILAAVGVTNALAAMHKAARSSDPALQDASRRLLDKWMTDDAAPVLLDLAKTMPEKKYRVRALRGYIRIARQFVLPGAKRAEMCGKALDAAEQRAEKMLVLEVLQRYPNGRTLRVAIEARNDPEMKEAATKATLGIARSLKSRGANVDRLLEKAGLPSPQ